MATDPHHTTILLAGPLTPTQRLREQVRGSRVVAADGGIAHAEALGLSPELWVGDFDSAGPAELDRYQHVERRTHTPLKDTTDGSLAIDEAMKAGAKRLTLVGAFGGRTDHSFALLATACALHARGIEVLLSSGIEEAVPLSSTRRAFDYKSGTRFSVLAFSKLSGLTIEGAYWPLDSVTMPFGDTLTLSNVVEGALALTVEKGTALLIVTL